MLLIKTSMTYIGATYRLGKIGSIGFKYRFKYYSISYNNLNYDYTPAIIREARIRQGKTIPTPFKLNVLTYPVVFKEFSDGF